MSMPFVTEDNAPATEIVGLPSNDCAWAIRPVGRHINATMKHARTANSTHEQASEDWSGDDLGNLKIRNSIE